MGITKLTEEELHHYNLRGRIDRLTVKILKKAMHRCKDNVSLVARLIGTERTYTYRLLDKLKIREMSSGKSKKKKEKDKPRDKRKSKKEGKKIKRKRKRKHKG